MPRPRGTDETEETRVCRHRFSGKSLLVVRGLAITESEVREGICGGLQVRLQSRVSPSV